jgi:hypothetical protein
MKDTSINFSGSPRIIDNLWFPLFIAFCLASIYLLPGLSSFIKLFFFHSEMPIEDSGFNYAVSSDGGLGFTPGLANLAYHLKYHSLKGIDFFTGNGASEFFVRANFSIFYPLTILFATILKASTFKAAVLVCFLLVYTHVFLAFLFLQLLGTQFFTLSKLESIFFAIMVVFSYVFAMNLFEQVFLMSYALFPMILYAMLISPFIEKKLGLLLLSLIYFSDIFVGYLPLPLFGILFSFLFSLCYIYFIHPEAYPNKRLALIRLLIPLLIAFLFAAPGCLAIVHYISYASTPGLKGLDYGAYSIPEYIKHFVLSLFTDVNHPESMLLLGPLFTFIWATFLLALNKTPFMGQPVYRQLFKFALIFSGITILISFGKALHLSTVFYYLVPAFGDMHQYQRYFGFGILFLMLATTFAFRFIMDALPLRLLKLMIAILLIATLMISVDLYYLHAPPLSSLIFSESVLTQYFLLFLLFISLVIFEKKGRWIAASTVAILIGLNTVYSTQITVPNGYLNTIVLDKNANENQNLIAFFKAYSHKELIKYVNLSSNIFTYIPLNYPWMVADQIKLSTYLGYEPHLAVDNAYRARIHGYGAVEIDWLSRTGADFVIYDKEAYQQFKNFIDTHTEANIRSPLSNDNVIAKLKPSFTTYMPGYSPDVFDNGYIELLHTTESPIITDFTASTSAIQFNLKINDSNSRLVLPFFANRHLKLYLNGALAAFKKEQDMYYYDFNQGPREYTVSIDYYYLPLNIFLYSMLIYYLILSIAGLYFLYARFLQNLGKQIEADHDEQALIYCESK